MQRPGPMLTERLWLMIYSIGYRLYTWAGADTAEKYTQDVNNPINLSTEEEL